MKRLLLFDLNVVLDVLFDRAPFATEAAALWTAAKDRDVIGLIPAHGFTCARAEGRARAHSIRSQGVALRPVAAG